jgi:hypothetical protein
MGEVVVGVGEDFVVKIEEAIQAWPAGYDGDV